MPQSDTPEPDEPIEVSSPVCYASEFEAPASPRRFESGDLVAFLNALLESERAALRVLRNWSLEAGHDADVGAWTLAAMRDDATRICARLWDHLAGLGAEPSSAVDPFHDAAMALTTWPDRLRALDDGQRQLIILVREALPRVADRSLSDLLRETLERHENNRRLLASAVASR